jgi:hypothetical protein
MEPANTRQERRTELVPAAAEQRTKVAHGANRWFGHFQFYPSPGRGERKSLPKLLLRTCRNLSDFSRSVPRLSPWATFVRLCEAGEKSVR